MSALPDRPWYKQLWPWLLMIPPVGAVIGGMLTVYLAVTRPDMLISKDCVRDGVTMVCGKAAPHKP
jgi:uncharacterized protein